MEANIILVAIVVAVVCFAFIILTAIDKDVMDIRNELREIHRTIKHTKP